MTIRADTPPPASSPADTDFLLAFLKDRDLPCPLCNYNLRNLQVPRCPECGREIKLSVGMTEPYLLPWALTTTFVAMSAGVGMLLLIACICFGPPPLDHMRRRDVPIFISMGYSILAIPLLFILITLRRRFLRINRGAQWAIAVIVFSINAAFVIYFFANVR